MKYEKNIKLTKEDIDNINILFDIVCDEVKVSHKFVKELWHEIKPTYQKIAYQKKIFDIKKRKELKKCKKKYYC